jgi:hypothetical protein
MCRLEEAASPQDCYGNWIKPLFISGGSTQTLSLAEARNSIDDAIIMRAMSDTTVQN